MSDTSGQDTNGAREAEKPAFELTTSRQFSNWLGDMKASVCFTTYQAGKVFLIGLKPDGKLSIFERTLDRCMGMVAHENSLYISTLYQLFRFENVLEDGQAADGHDRVFVPQVGYITGDLDVHDLGVDADGRLIFVNTLFGCLATPSMTHSFEPIWQPPFLSKLAAEDRCHLNGLAMRDGRPAYVTAVGESDVADGWRDHRWDGGIIIDVASGEVVCRGLSMPHSPRWHDGKLWVANSGTGEFGTVNLKSGKFEPLCFCPGYIRGVSFVGDYAVVGLSKPRENRTFTGLPLDEALTSRKAEPRCGLYVIDLKTGDTVHWLRLEGAVEELYDVVALPKVIRPMAIGFRSDEIRRVISVGDDAPMSLS